MIAPVGFEIDRVVKPAKGIKNKKKGWIIEKAERVYLLVHNKKSEDKASAYADEIVKKLKAAKIKTEKVPCNWYSIDGINSIIELLNYFLTVISLGCRSSQQIKLFTKLAITN